jgi:hypothetical protein
MPHKKEFAPNAKYFKLIDWLLVQRLIDERLSGVEIAKRIGIHPNTLYMRVRKEHGWLLTHWMWKRRFVQRGLDFEIRGKKFNYQDPHPHIQTLK